MKRFCISLFLIVFISSFISAQKSDHLLSCNASFQVYTITPQSDTVRLNNNSVIQNLTSDEKIIYDWDFGDLSKSRLTNPVHIYANPGYYNICLTTRIILKKILPQSYAKATLAGRHSSAIHITT